MDTPCVKSCKGLCSALEVAEHREREAIKMYREYVTSCVYPDVRGILEELVREREHALQVLREKREELTIRFATVDRINDSFA